MRYCMSVTYHYVYFSAINCNEVLRFNASSRSNVTMKMIAYAAAEKQVYVVASGGVLIACSSTLPALIDANFIPQKREFPGQGRVIYSLAIIPSTNGCVDTKVLQEFNSALKLIFTYLFEMEMFTVIFI